MTADRGFRLHPLAARLRCSACLLSLCAAALSQELAFAQESFPDPAILLQQVQANQHKMDQIRENYTFHIIRRTDQLDKNGTILKTTTVEREVFFVNGRRIARLVKQDGKELTPAEDKAEQARVKKVVETAIKDGPKPAQGRVGPPANQKLAPFVPSQAPLRGQVSQKPRPVTPRLNEMSEILAVVKVSNPRRVMLNGRTTLAYDFTGDPKAHSHGMEQNAAKKMSGTMWFDEHEKQVARLEVRFDDNFHIGGGLLASVQKGTTMEFEQAPVGDGLWMQTSSVQHLDARVMVAKVREDVHVTNFDFKKFSAEALQTK